MIRARPYKADAVSGKARARVFTWAARSRRWSGRPVMITTSGRDSHCLVVCDGHVYDNWMPAGAAAREHPFSTALVNGAWLVEQVR